MGAASRNPHYSTSDADARTTSSHGHQVCAQRCRGGMHAHILPYAPRLDNTATENTARPPRSVVRLRQTFATPTHGKTFLLTSTGGSQHSGRSVNRIIRLRILVGISHRERAPGRLRLLLSSSRRRHRCRRCYLEGKGVPHIDDRSRANDEPATKNKKQEEACSENNI